MYERLLNKEAEPTLEEIKETLGEDALRRLTIFEETLQKEYSLQKALRYPFGKGYGWGYKYAHKAVHLCYAFIEKGAFTVTVQIGDGRVAAVETCAALSEKGRALWEKRYPCGERGGWVHLRVISDADLADALLFVHAKKAPVTAG